MSKPSLEKVFLKEYDSLHSPEHEVLVEGKFLEISPSGQGMDQVWLGLTRTEFVISDLTYSGRKFLASKRSRESQTVKYSTAGAKGDENYLKLRRTYPVKFIRILIIDDRAKRMAVATSTSNMTFYEMSKPKDHWERWKHAAVKLHQKQLRYRIRQRQTSKPTQSLGDELYSPESRYISYPLVCRRITDKGIQTDPIPEVVGATQSPNKVDEQEPPAVDDLGHIVVQEYEVVFERVAFHYEDDMLRLFEMKRSHNVARSSSNTCLLSNDLFTRSPQKSTSCPSLWKSVDSITHGTSLKSREKHFARRKLNTDEIHIVQEMIQYRNSQIDNRRVSGHWNTCFTWNWADSGNLGDIDIEKLMEEAKPGAGMASNAGQSSGSTCTSCGHSGPRQTPDRGSSVGAFDLVEYISTAEVREYQAGEIAMQLTLRDRNLLWQLSQTDITRLALSRPPRWFKDISTLALIKMSAWSDRVGRLVATEILDQPNYDSCLETIKLFIKVAEFCWMIRNVNSFANVMRGLQFYSVYRLGLVWEYIHKTEPQIGELYLTMCEKMAKLYDLSVSMSHLPSSIAKIPWFPALVCELVNETVHLQHNHIHLKGQTDAMVDLDDLEVVLVRHVESQTIVPKSVLMFANMLSSSIIKEGVKEASWQVFDSGSSEAEDADPEVDKVDARAFDYLHRGKKVVDDSVAGLARRGVLTLLGEKSSDDEFAPADNAPADKTIRGRFVRFVKGKPPASDIGSSSKTLLNTAKEGISKAIPDPIKSAPTKIAHTAHEGIARVIPLPERFQPEPSADEMREPTLVEKLSGKTKPVRKRRKSILESVKDVVTGQEEEEVKEEKPYIHKTVDKDLEQLLETLKIDEANEPKDTVHVVANKSRTPKLVRFFGRFLRKKKSTKSMGGTPYEPTEADMALLSFPTTAAMERSTFVYSDKDKKREVRDALNTQNQTKDMARRKSLLASSEAFSEVNDRFKDLNTNVNAIGSPRHHHGKHRSGTRTNCEVCISSNCRYKGEPAKYLIEAQLAASKYAYLHNKVADRFLTRRPVLSDYALLESFHRTKT